jgi:protoheme IX farnesyltransferase
MATFKEFYSLAKPGVLYGNALTAAAGFLLAARGHIDIWLFLALVVGSTLVIASACVLNNFLDQDIDSKMARTKKRAIVSGKVKGHDAVILSIVLGVVGLAVLIAWTNWLVVLVGIIGFVDYVVLYGMLSKRLSIHGTLVGSISGAAPILAGYVAVSGAFDPGAIIVFAAMFLWQMPEFYSIAIYRMKEYKAAGVPVISVVKGKEHTRLQIFFYTVAFVVSTLLLTPYGYTGYSYLIIMGLLGAYWLYLAVIGFKASDIDAWARRMFRFSLIILLAFCAMISIGWFLP